jgi:hypothetical protein
MRKIKMLIVLMFVMVASLVSAASMLFECDTVGARLEVYNYEIRDWSAPIPFPVTRVEAQYEMLLIRVTAPNYETFEQNFEATSYPQRFVINLVPEDYAPAGVPLFGWAGQLISKRGLVIMPNSYKIVMRNLTTHVKTNPTQVSQDIQPNATDGHFSCCLANFATTRSPNGSAALPGDRVFVGAFNSSMTVCYGHVVRILTEEDVDNAGVYMNIFVR